MIQTQIGSASGRKTKTGACSGVIARAHSAERASAHRNTRVPRPTQIPATAPSIAHLNVLISSAVCSVYQRVSSARRGDSLSLNTMLRSCINRARRPDGISFDQAYLMEASNRLDHSTTHYGRPFGRISVVVIRNFQLGPPSGL